MAVIVKADIIADVNDNLLTNFASGGTDIDRQINKVLVDMSNRGLLVGTDSTQTLVDGSKTLDYPTGYRSSIDITLTDSSGNELKPLIPLQGGQKEYRKQISYGGGTVIPRWFSEFDDKFYLVGKSAAAYTVLIEFRKNHPKDPDNIEFTTKYENLMFAGATFYYAAKLGRANALAIWGPIYREELRVAVLNRKNQSSIMRG